MDKESAPPGGASNEQLVLEDIREKLKAFSLDESKTELDFPPTLDSKQRKLVHDIADELLLEHFSTGKGAARFIRIRKRSEKDKEAASPSAGNSQRPSNGSKAAGGKGTTKKRGGDDDDTGPEFVPVSGTSSSLSMRSLRAPRVDKKLMKRILKEGHGRTPEPGAAVRIIYEGRLEGGQPFDSPEDRESAQKEMSFILGKGKTIAGLDIGICTMRKGEVAEFVIAPELAFGELGCPPRIPPDATVEYEVQLLDVENMWSDDHSKDVEEALRRGAESKEDGNTHYAAGSWRKAASAYYRGITHLAIRGLPQECHERVEQARYALHLNLAAAHLKLGEPRKAIEQCEKAVKTEADPLSPKPHFRLAQAFSALGYYETALGHLATAAKFAPEDRAIEAEIKRTRKMMAEAEKTSGRIFLGVLTVDKNKEKAEGNASVNESDKAKTEPK